MEYVYLTVVLILIIWMLLGKRSIITNVHMLKLTANVIIDKTSIER